MIYVKYVIAFTVCSLRLNILLGITSSSIGIGVDASTIPPGNFSCYQCAVTSLYEKCGPETLKPCAQTADRCVTHITRSSSSPLIVRKECGLGPCAFESENSDATAVLGMDPNHCDVNRPEVFCVFCCRGSGCNGAATTDIHHINLTLIVVLLWKQYIR